MPKKRDNKTKRSLSVKFRIGNAKGGVSAHSLSTQALRDILENKDKARSHNARRVLILRGDLSPCGQNTFELVRDAGPFAGDPA